MRVTRGKLAAFLLVAALTLSFGVLVPLAAGRGGSILEFNTMAPVTGPYVGAANPIRGLNGGGLPWAITDAHGVLGDNGHLELNVNGLVLAAGPLSGTNPITSFRAVVSCLSITDGNATTVNVSSDLFPASATGDAHLNTRLSLPSPCIAPIVFVTSPSGAWFAATGN